MTAPSKTNSRNASLRLSMRKMSSLLKYILYLPHHAVVQQHKTTTKLHVVYDASAKDDGPSLNECLYKSPKFNQLVLDLLLCFQSYPITLTADVEKAFLMVAVNSEGRVILPSSPI